MNNIDEQLERKIEQFTASFKLKEEEETGFLSPPLINNLFPKDIKIRNQELADAYYRLEVKRNHYFNSGNTVELTKNDKQVLEDLLNAKKFIKIIIKAKTTPEILKGKKLRAKRFIKALEIIYIKTDNSRLYTYVKRQLERLGELENISRGPRKNWKWNSNEISLNETEFIGNNPDFPSYKKQVEDIILLAKKKFENENLNVRTNLILKFVYEQLVRKEFDTRIKKKLTDYKSDLSKRIDGLNNPTQISFFVSFLFTELYDITEKSAYSLFKLK